MHKGSKTVAVEFLKSDVLSPKAVMAPCCTWFRIPIVACTHSRREPLTHSPKCSGKAPLAGTHAMHCTWQAAMDHRDAVCARPKQHALQQPQRAHRSYQ